MLIYIAERTAIKLYAENRDSLRSWTMMYVHYVAVVFMLDPQIENHFHQKFSLLIANKMLNAEYSLNAPVLTVTCFQIANQLLISNRLVKYIMELQFSGNIKLSHQILIFHRSVIEHIAMNIVKHLSYG